MLMAWVGRNLSSLLLNWDGVEIYRNLVYILLKTTVNDLISLPCFPSFKYGSKFASSNYNVKSK
jgi:hypothetical protein